MLFRIHPVVGVTKSYDSSRKKGCIIFVSTTQVRCYSTCTDWGTYYWYVNSKIFDEGRGASR